ncbi:ComF family protein [Robertkochia sediminum]|uniref:ComF family protein n=1 Tax=Robertkochia sediminum TaxID=2785326 RepID=UPI0019346F0A|nr:phosphoribosyltransferase family protein [Robertkochia sediminum]MBL7471939.1 ComF family protein [Robertkochia sediminum]
MRTAVKIVNDLQNLFFPGACLSCRAILPLREQLVCVTCLHQLPQTHFTDRPENQVERIFYGRVRIEAATALFWFHKKGAVQQIIHELKYRKQQYAGSWMGEWMYEEMQRSSRFQDIDLVLPMPLQKRKLRKRGYNQTHTFAKAIAQGSGVTLGKDVLTRTDRSGAFAFRGRQTRALETGPVFEVDAEALKPYKHVLLTDDVVTTGTTLEAAARAIKTHADIKISIATMAITA